MMRISELIRDLPIVPAGLDADVDVTGVTHDSRRVDDGDLFVALSGESFDGREFAGEARDRGAAAVLAAGEPPADWPGPWLHTDEPRRVLGPLAARVYGHPDRELLLAGVTGTNGKSTVAALIAAVLEAAGRPSAVLGTLGLTFGDLRRPVEHTTPEATELYGILRETRDAGAEAVVMEVSSHALAQHRVGGAGFDLAVFLNLSRDHLDYHRDLEDYFGAKRRLFSQLAPGGRAVVNVDDEHGRRLAAELAAEPDRPAVTFGRDGDVRVTAAELDNTGTRATFATPGGAIEVCSPLLGRYNLENLSAAVAAGVALEVEPEVVARGLGAAPPLPGRMEPVDRGQPFGVLVDYAHTPDALAAVLGAARELSDRRLIVVFGCGGDRDTGKRVPMGRIAGELADLPIATSDNPRSEDPAAILAEVEVGLRQSGNSSYLVVPDRRKAIREAIGRGQPGGSVVVAGKGHEEVQLVGTEVLPFSDRREIEQALEEWFGAGTDG